MPESSNNNTYAPTVEGGDKMHTQSSTTGINTDANVVSAEITHPSRIDNLLVQSSTTNFSQDLKTFLEKPVVIQSGRFQSADTVSTFPGINIPDQLVNSTIYSNKVSGFLGLKADIVFRLQVNGTRFQQGRYMLTFTSTAGASPTSVPGILWIHAHTVSLTTRTQLPHLEMDVNCDTEGYLKIPFVSAYNFYPLVSKGAVTKIFGDIGQVRIFPYSPLQFTTGQTYCTYTLWAHFENIQFIVPAAPQARFTFASKKRKSTTEIEADSQGVGPISSTLLTVAKASNILSSVPLLSAYANTASWITDILGNAAAAFGWSKPMNMEPGGRMQQQIGTYLGTFDGADNVHPLSLSVKNEVSDVKGFSGTDVDELALSYIATIPAYFNTVTWNASALPGAILTERECDYSFYTLINTLNGQIIKYYTPMSFVASHFNMWRGSIVFTFKFVKTEFHSGRVAVVFFPHTDGYPVPARSLTLSDYAHREIIDIRECNQFTVRVPYTAISPYRNSQTGFRSFGTVSLYVVDQLVAPDQVPTDISILVEVAAGDDCEFAVAKNNYDMPTFNIAPQMADIKFSTNVCEILETDIGGSSKKEDKLLNAGAAIGERVLTFRQLAKVGGMITSAITYTSTNVYANVLPWAMICNYNTTVPVIANYTADLVSRLTACYGLGRGGIRWRFVNNNTMSNNANQVAYLTYPDTTASKDATILEAVNDPLATVTPKTRLGMSNVYTQAAINPIMEVQVPQYTLTHSRVNAHQIVVNTQCPYVFTSMQPRAILTTTVPGALAAPQWSFHRSLADDATFGQFISIPGMWEDTRATTTITRSTL